MAFQRPQMAVENRYVKNGNLMKDLLGHRGIKFSLTKKESGASEDSAPDNSLLVECSLKGLSLCFLSTQNLQFLPDQ